MLNDFDDQQSMETGWVTGDDPDLVCCGVIGSGGSGEIYEASFHSTTLADD
jgi:hypothetical protein